MAGAVRSHEPVTLFWRKRPYRGFDASKCFWRAAGHDRVADLQSPDTAAGAAVDELEAAGLNAFGARLRVLPLRVAAVHEEIARRADVHELIQVLVGHAA